jgi:hypothetical protein
VDDDMLAEVRKNAYLMKMMQDAGLGYDDGLFKYNRAPPGLDFWV